MSTSEVKTDQITNINDAPIIKSIPKQTIKLNQRFTYAVKAEDPDGPSELIYSLLNKPVGMAINASTGEITWTPTQTDSNIQVNVQVDDGSKTGNTKDNEMFFITVMGDKDKTKEQPEKLIPSINAIPIASGMDIEAIEQVAKKITLQGSDADNTPEQITYKIVEPPEYGTTTEPNGAVVTYTSTSDTATEDSFTYRVCDEVLCSEKATVSLSIEPQNDRFKIITTDIAEAIEGAEYYLELKVQDPDSDNLLFTFREKPSWLSFDNNKNPIRVSLINRDEIFATTLKFKGTPQNRHVGENKIKLEITDGFGKNKLVDSHEFTINVSNTDDKGQIEIKGDPKQNETLEATVTDGDGIEGDKISYQWQRGSETIDGAEGPSYMLTQKDVGSIISVNATYTDLRSGIKHSLTKPTDSIENVNDAPTLSGDPDTEVNQDKDYEFTPTVADIDKKDTFTYSIVNQPDWAKFDSSTGTLSGTPKNQHVGTSEGIVISVNDGHGGNAWLPSFNIKVINEDDPPVLQSIDNKSVKEDFERFTIELSATDIDIDDTITYDFSPKEIPIANLTIEGNQLKIKAIEDANGTQEITIIAKSNDKQHKQLFTLTISPVNDAPTAPSKSMKIVATEGEPEVFTLQGSDIDNKAEDLSYKIIQQPQYAKNIELGTESIDNNVTYTSTSDTATEDNFTYKVCDKDDLCSDEIKVSITINPIDDKPEVVDSVIAKATEDVEYTLELKVKDPDSASLEVTLQPSIDWLELRSKSLKKEGDKFTIELFGTPLNQHVGDLPVTLQITDNTSKVSHGFTINISNTDDKGQIEIKGGTKPIPKQNDILTAKVTDEDGVDENNISYQWQRDGEAIDGKTGKTYRLTQDDVGSIISVNAIYEDNYGKAENPIESMESQVINVNDAPTLSGFPDTEVNQDDPYVFTPKAEDIDGESDTLRFSIKNKPDWAEFDRAKGTLNGTPKDQHVGTSEGIVISVTDSQGAKAS